MKQVSLLLVVLFIAKVSISQDNRYVVNAGVKVNDVIPVNEIFQYSGFINGKVIFRDDNVFEGRMNYNRLMDEILFISEKGDTLALKNEATIRLVCIANDTFYFDHGYIILINHSPNLKLGMKPCFRFIDKTRIAAYDGMSSTSSVSSISSFDDGATTYQLEVKELSILVKDTLYYVGDRYNRFVPATKKGFIGFSQDCTKQLNRFCKKNKIDFEDKYDLERLIDYAEERCFSL